MSHPDLGPMPAAEAEEPELHPGGADAVLDRETDPVAADPVPGDNPATEDSPPETGQGEDTSTEATRGGGDVEPHEESPA